MRVRRRSTTVFEHITTVTVANIASTNRGLPNIRPIDKHQLTKFRKEGLKSTTEEREREREALTPKKRLEIVGAQERERDNQTE